MYGFHRGILIIRAHTEVAYQTFIDLLTNHGKTTSSAFLQLYSTISEAPDPYPLLEASVDALLLSEDTLPKITSENEHLQKSVTTLTSQLDATERQLEEEKAARKELEETRNSKLREVESSWRAVIEEKQDNWETKERSLEEKVQNQERLLKELKASFEVAQRLGHNDDGDEMRQSSAYAAELEIVSTDLDRTTQRLAEVEARNEQLRVELAEALSSTQRSSVVEDDPTNVRLRVENSSLLRQLDAARLEKDSEARKRENRIRALERDTRMLQNEKEALRERVHAWRDYTDIKRELEIFKVSQVLSGDNWVLIRSCSRSSFPPLTMTKLVYLPMGWIVGNILTDTQMVCHGTGRMKRLRRCSSRETRSSVMTWRF